MPSITYQVDGENITRSLDGGVLHIGRLKECEIRLEHKAVSKVHAALSCSEDGWTITDLESHNHTYVNGIDIFRQPPVQLRHADLIQINRYLLQYSDPSTSDGEASTISLVAGLKDGEANAIERIWAGYFAKLTFAAKRKLGRTPLRGFDEEDVALSVIHSLCRGAAAGRFERLKNEHDLWHLLLAITRQKAVDRIRHETCKKNNAGQTRGESVFRKLDDGSLAVGIDQIAGKQPTPEFVMEMDERCQTLLALLPKAEMREIAKRRLEQFTVEQIAEHFGKSTRWVEKQLQAIRRIWMEELNRAAE